MLDFVDIEFSLWKMLLKCSDQERRVYMSLYYQSNVYTCETHLLTIADISEHAEIKDRSDVYKALRGLIEKKFIEELPCKSGFKQYKFLWHVPKEWKHNSKKRIANRIDKELGVE